MHCTFELLFMLQLKFTFGEMLLHRIHWLTKHLRSKSKTMHEKTRLRGKKFDVELIPLLAIWWRFFFIPAMVLHYKLQ